MRSEEKKAVKLSPAEALAKIQHYCAYQERSHREVKDKLFGYGLRSADVDDVVTHLITCGFLNEERFAKAFAGGKFRMKKWGRLKIKRELELYGLTKNCIAMGLKEIDERDYRKSLRQIIEKKWEQTLEINPYKKKDKVARFAIAKGYEPELVWSLLEDWA